jgi:AcrR family transcriptional regulator
VPADTDHVIHRRRRGAALEEALLDAAWDELCEVGYASFTVDGVARRAGTSRPVLYRRWPNRAQLVLAAIRAHVPSLPPEDFPDTGQLRGDLLAELTLMRDRYYRIGPEIMNGLASELAQLPADVLDALLPITAAIVARAADRGEIGMHPVPAHVLAVPQALLRHELGLLHHRPTDAELARIVDDVTIPAIQHASHHLRPWRTPGD